MHDASEFPVPITKVMGGVQTRSCIRCHAHGNFGGKCAAALRGPNDVAKRIAFDPLHYHVENVIVLGDLVDAHDIVMLNALNDLNLTQKHRTKFRVPREFGQHRLDCNQALLSTDGGTLSRDPHTCHSAAPDTDQQFIMAEEYARLKLTHRKEP